MAVRTVGVVGTGVIGASWAALFLARGLRVLVAARSPASERKFSDVVDAVWPTFEGLGLSPGASRANCVFVGPSLAAHYAEFDLVQEVSRRAARPAPRPASLLRGNRR